MAEMGGVDDGGRRRIDGWMDGRMDGWTDEWDGDGGWQVRHPDVVESTYYDTRLLFEVLDVCGQVRLLLPCLSTHHAPRTSGR